MIVEEKDTYIILRLENLDELKGEALDKYIIENDIALVLSDHIAFSDELSSLLETATNNADTNKKAFVVVHSNVEMMDLLDDFCICLPTLSEAHDYIYMEQLERNF